LQESEAAASLANEERMARPTTAKTQSLHDTPLAGKPVPTRTWQCLLPLRITDRQCGGNFLLLFGLRVKKVVAPKSL
jgi:hypothetical protein